MAGYYAFLILIINYIYSYIAPFTTHRLIDTYLTGNTEPPMGMSKGEMVAFFSLIPKTIDVIAFTILIFGLYRMWNSKKYD